MTPAIEAVLAAAVELEDAIRAYDRSGFTGFAWAVVSRKRLALVAALKAVKP